VSQARELILNVRLFAILRERAGADTVQLRLAPGATVADALRSLAGHEQLREPLARMRVVMAVNREYADADAPLRADDELALIPPVSGGAVSRASLHVRVTGEPLAPDALASLVSDPRAGAVVTFLGVTREVPALEYEAYAEMAEQRIAEIVADAAERHGLCGAAAEHRIGTVALSEPSVAVAVSAPHRSEAFAGAREIIDRIKSEAPIWKQEEGEWVRGVTPG
jgi:molybdopterin synthase catalytic subunit